VCLCVLLLPLLLLLPLCLQWPRKAAAAGAGADSLAGGPSAAADATQFMQQVLRTNVRVPGRQISQHHSRAILKLHVDSCLCCVACWDVRQPELNSSMPVEMR
jgi:hypothetical protein